MISLKNTFITILFSLIYLADLKSDMQSRTINFSVGSDMIADGKFIGNESINLNVGKTLKGTGFFKSPNIYIQAKKFEFTGTIECDKTCYITTQEPFNKKMFKRAGKGKFIITVDKSSSSEKNESSDSIGNLKSREPYLNNIPERKAFNISGCDFTINGKWNVAVCEALKNGDSDKVYDLLGKNPDCKNDKQMLTIFMMVAGLLENIPLVEEFIKLGAKIDEQDSSGTTCLMTAVLLQKPKFVEALVKAGANPNTKRNWSDNPALIIATLKEDINSVKALLKSEKIDIDVMDVHRQTALMLATSKGYTGIVEILLEAGANPEIRNIHWVTPLDIAIDRKYKEIENLIRKKLRTTRNIQTESPEEKTLIKKIGLPGIIVLTYVGIVALKWSYDTYMKN